MDHGASSYRRYLEGEEGAFDEVMEGLFRNLVFFIDRYVRDVHEAEDLAMDTMTELLLHPKGFDFRVSLKTYLFMIGKSKALDHLRRMKRRKTEPVESLGSLTDGQDLEELVLKEERKRLVNRALDRLPGEMAMAVHLVYLEDLSYEEAAKLMKKKPKQIDNLLYRAKRELRQILGKEDVLL